MIRRSPYWEVVLKSGRVLSERESVLDIRNASMRSVDWALDLVSTGDVLKIVELRLIAPNGQQGTLGIDEPGTAFQTKRARFRPFSYPNRVLECQIIGRVHDKESGACSCWVWDREYGLFPYISNIYDFGTWRENLIPEREINQAVTGLRLGVH